MCFNKIRRKMRIYNIEILYAFGKRHYGVSCYYTVVQVQILNL